MNINYNLLIMFHLEEACQEQFIQPWVSGRIQI